MRLQKYIFFCSMIAFTKILHSGGEISKDFVILDGKIIKFINGYDFSKCPKTGLSILVPRIEEIEASELSPKTLRLWQSLGRIVSD